MFDDRAGSAKIAAVQLCCSSIGIVDVVSNVGGISQQGGTFLSGGLGRDVTWAAFREPLQVPIWGLRSVTGYASAPITIKIKRDP